MVELPPQRSFRMMDIAGLSLLWGSSYLFFKILAASWGPMTIVFGRVGVASLFLMVVLRFKGQNVPRGRSIWMQFAVLGLLNNVIPFMLVADAIRFIPSALGAILNIATPVLTALAAHFFTRDEKLSASMVLGLALAATGVVILVGFQAVQVGSRSTLLPQLMFLAASLSFAAAAVYGRRLRDVPPLALAAGQLSASTLITLPFCLFFEQPWTLPPPTVDVWGALLGISVLSSGLAYILFFRILAAGGAAASQLVTFTLPAVAIVNGAAVLGESLPVRAYLATALIGLGLLFATSTQGIKRRHL